MKINVEQIDGYSVDGKLLLLGTVFLAIGIWVSATFGIGKGWWLFVTSVALSIPVLFNWFPYKTGRREEVVFAWWPVKIGGELTWLEKVTKISHIAKRSYGYKVEVEYEDYEKEESLEEINAYNKSIIISIVCVIIGGILTATGLFFIGLPFLLGSLYLSIKRLK